MLQENKYAEAKNKLLNNVENFYKGTEKIIEGFKIGVFPFYCDKQYEHQIKCEREIEEIKKEEKRRRREGKKEKQKKGDRIHLIYMKLLSG